MVSGRASSMAACALAGSRLWKSQFWLHGGDMFQTGLSLHTGEENAPGARFFWEKREDAGNWIAQTPSIQIPLALRHHLQKPITVSIEHLLCARCGARLLSCIIADLHKCSMRSLLLRIIIFLFYQQEKRGLEKVHTISMVTRVYGGAGMLRRVSLNSSLNVPCFSEAPSTSSPSPQTTLG